MGYRSAETGSLSPTDVSDDDRDVTKPVRTQLCCEFANPPLRRLDEIRGKRHVLDRVTRECHFGEGDDARVSVRRSGHRLTNQSAVALDVTHNGVDLGESETNPRHNK